MQTQRELSKKVETMTATIVLIPANTLPFLWQQLHHEQIVSDLPERFVERSGKRFEFSLVASTVTLSHK
jgi:hypothetical protein